MKLQCDMRKDCTNQVTHLGSKGYVYCAACAPNRRGYEGTRKLARWEVRRLEAGETLQSYKPISEVEHVRRATPLAEVIA